MAKLALVGMGRMGSAIATRLATGDHQVATWDLKPNMANARQISNISRETSAAHAAKGAAGIFLCLPNTQAIETVIFGRDGIGENVSTQTLIIDHSTIHPQAAKEIAARVHDEFGATYMDAPVSGGPDQARAGRLVVWAAGPKSDFDRAAVWMQRYGSRVVYTGPTGSAQKIKACNQLVVCSTIVAWMEVVTLADSLQLDPQNVIKQLKGASSDSMLREFFVTQIFENRENETIRNFRKDIDIVLELSRNDSIYKRIAAISSALNSESDVDE